MGESIGYPEDINNIEKENKPFFAVVCKTMLIYYAYGGIISNT